MKKLPTVVLLFTALIILAGIFVFGGKDQSTPTPTPKSDSYIYFYSDTCPHCTNVAEFLETWEGKDKINLDKKEVSTNISSARELSQAAKSCDIPTNEVGVPFLYTPEGECIVGDTPIIDFFNSLDN